MAGAADQKTDWNLGETVVWIRTRDHDRVAAMWEMSELDAVTIALFDPGRLPRWVIEPTAADSGDALRQTPIPGEAALEVATSAAPAAMHGLIVRQMPPTTRDEPPADQILRDIMRRVQTGSVRMSMITANVERVAVTAVEASDLELRITGDQRVPVQLWSRVRERVVGRSPWFARRDVIRAWPEWSKKTIAATGAILRHLRQISTAEHPLTRDEARTRCEREVPDYYSEAFRKAWAALEPSRKRGRGKHGPRVH